MGGGSKAMSLVVGPGACYQAIVDKGESLCNESPLKIFALATFAGCFIGFGALLSLTIGGSILPAVASHGSGLQTWVYASLFPVNLLFILLSGSILYTGATFTTPSAVIEGKAKWHKSVIVIVVSWLGNMVGGWGFAIFTDLCGLNDGAVAEYVVKISISKVTKGWGKIFLRGIGCNWLVCMAVFLCTMAQDMTGKYVGIFFPISTFVACGFEHYPANAYALPLAVLALSKDEYKDPEGPSFWTMLWENLIPCSLGNLVAGVVIMSMGNSFFFGKLKTCPCLFTSKKGGSAREPTVSEPTPEQQAPPAQASPPPTQASQPEWTKEDSGFARTVSC
mmetsp:Transcript_38665/g.76612  ORF Transcript_38665/g.76612 Transcript_38665/m.76612 type:complete len:335 (-) Transcript_38665:50-1054(-)